MWDTVTKLLYTSSQTHHPQGETLISFIYFEFIYLYIINGGKWRILCCFIIPAMTVWYWPVLCVHSPSPTHSKSRIKWILFGIRFGHTLSTFNTFVCIFQTLHLKNVLNIHKLLLFCSGCVHAILLPKFVKTVPDDCNYVCFNRGLAPCNGRYSWDHNELNINCDYHQREFISVQPK